MTTDTGTTGGNVSAYQWNARSFQIGRASVNRTMGMARGTWREDMCDLPRDLLLLTVDFNFGHSGDAERVVRIRLAQRV